MPIQPKPPSERFWRFVHKTPTCWEWTGAKNYAGYGHFSVRTGTAIRAHRFAYQLLVGAIPRGRELHHKCENRACVRPDHLRVVTHRENLLVSSNPIIRKKSHCARGHALTDANLYIDPRGRRACRTCKQRCGREYKRVRALRRSS